MDELDRARMVGKFIMLCFSGVIALGLGVFLLITGNAQTRGAGAGAAGSGVIILGFGGWAIYRFQKQQAIPEEKKIPEVPLEDEVVPEGMTMRQLFILGLCLCLGSPLMYLYLQATVDNGAASAGLVLLVPLILAGLGCMGISVWRSKKK